MKPMKQREMNTTVPSQCREGGQVTSYMTKHVSIMLFRDLVAGNFSVYDKLKYV